MRIYVGNLSYDVTEDALRQEFTAFGKVTAVSIMMDRDTGRPKGFAFVEMEAKTEAEAAITGLNGKAIQNRAMTVNEARPRPDNGPRPFQANRTSRPYDDRRSGGNSSGGGGGRRGGYGGGGGGGYGGGGGRSDRY